MNKYISNFRRPSTKGMGKGVVTYCDLHGASEMLNVASRNRGGGLKDGKPEALVVRVAKRDVKALTERLKSKT